jgi:pimeloyl-ACP methyl ester carboxylesterase
LTNHTKTFGRNRGLIFRSNRRHFFSLMTCLILLFSVFGYASAQETWPHIAFSEDGTPISYEVYGTGDPTLIFVHGWCCDSRYWREQVPEFSRKYRVVVLDLTGHGHSGMSRIIYSISSFGEDVKAVTEAVGGHKVILIGHSMGGPVIAEAARLMPERVIGLIGIDTFKNVESSPTKEVAKTVMAALEKNFPDACRQFIGRAFSPKTDPQLREWILSDMSSAPPQVALSVSNDMIGQSITGETAKMFEDIRIPVMTINGDLESINYEANRKHMLSFDAVVIKEAGHFLMTARPDEFNKELQKTILKLISK